jgi:hypothetical protein
MLLALVPGEHRCDDGRDLIDRTDPLPLPRPDSLDHALDPSEMVSVQADDEDRALEPFRGGSHDGAPYRAGR